MWCICICINSIDHPFAHSALPEAVSMVRVYLFHSQFPLSQRLHVYPRNISKKNYKNASLAPPPPNAPMA